MVKTKDYVIDGVTYHAYIYKKAIRRLYVGMPNEKREFSVRVPYLTLQLSIDQAVKELLPKLLRRKVKYDKREALKPFGEDYTYILGEKSPLVFASEDEFLPYAKKNILPLYEEKIRYYEERMGIKKPYKLILRNMTTRYGVNSSRTHRITLNSVLCHYPMEVGEAILVHELAHDFQRNHSDKFYAIVYRYCPDYRRLHAKLNRHDYENDHLQG